MIRIDDSLLDELGLISLPKQEREQLLRQIYETLEMRVGMKLAERMSEQQLNEFEAFIDTNDEGGALGWLESNFPNYKQVVSDELTKLKQEIKQDAPRLVEAVNQANNSPRSDKSKSFSQQQAPSGGGNPAVGGFNDPAGHDVQSLTPVDAPDSPNFDTGIVGDDRAGSNSSGLIPPPPPDL